MPVPTLLEKIKGQVRVSTTTLDALEITPLIESAKADLILDGVLASKVVDTDALIERAVTLYVKANFGLNNPDSEKYRAAYLQVKQALTLSADYTTEDAAE